MIPRISHDRRDESLEAKARWFQSLTVQERLDVFCGFMDMTLSLNPGLLEHRRARPVSGRVQVLRAP